MAQFTLFDLTLEAHSKVGTVTFGISSAGGTTFLNDRTESSAHADDQFNSGQLFIIESTNTGIQGQVRRVADYVASSGQYNFTTALTSAVTAGTKYALPNHT